MNDGHDNNLDDTDGNDDAHGCDDDDDDDDDDDNDGDSHGGGDGDGDDCNHVAIKALPSLPSLASSTSF